jgi:hypothetical protein
MNFFHRSHPSHALNLSGDFGYIRDVDEKHRNVDKKTAERELEIAVS